MYPLDFLSLGNAAVQLITTYESLYGGNIYSYGDRPSIVSSNSNSPSTSSNTLVRPTPLRPAPLHKREDTSLSLATQSRQSVIHVGSRSQKACPGSQSALTSYALDKVSSEWIAFKLAASTSSNRMSYPREFKLMVIDHYHRNGQNKYRTCKEFQITKSMLNGWLSKIEKIRESRPGSLKSGRSGRRPQFPDIEKQLFDLYCQHLESGNKIGNRWLRERARELAGDVNVACQFSERWLSNFKKRFHISLQRDNDSSADSHSIHSTSSEKQAYSDIDVDSPNDLADQEMEIRKELVAEIVNQPGQLPIQVFYEKFPWLCKKGYHVEAGRRGRKVQFPDVERVLYERLREKQKSGERISNRWLQDQARDLAAELCPGILENALKSSRCLFSEHWLHNFKKRYGISLKYKLVTREHANEFSSIPDETSPSTPNEDNTNPTMLQLQSWLMHQSCAFSLWQSATLPAQTLS